MFSRGRRRRGRGPSASGVGSGRPSVSVSAPYSVVSSSSVAPSASGGPVVSPKAIGSLRDDLLAVIREEFRSIQQQLPPLVGPSHSGPGPLPGLVSAELCVGARVRGNLLLVVHCEFYGLPRVMLLAPRPVYCYGP